MATPEVVEGLRERLCAQHVAAYDRSDAVDELFDVWLETAAAFTKGALDGGAGAVAVATSGVLGALIDDRTGVFAAGSDDFFVRLLTQQFAKIVGLFVEKPKLAAAVQAEGGAPLLLWLSGSAIPALGAAALDPGAPSSHRVEYLKALKATFELERVALDAGRDGLVHSLLDPLLARIAAADEDELVRTAAVELLGVVVQHQSRAALATAAARTLAAAAASRVVFSLCWRLGGLSDAACLASVQQRCRGDVRLPSEVLAALESAVTDGCVDARRDSTAICEILRSCQQTGPGGGGLLPSAEEGIPGHEGASSSSGRAAAAMDLFRALLDRCPDREDYLRCLLEPTVVPIEALELVSARASAIPEPLWIAVILPFVEQLLSGASRGRDGALEQESILLLRECVSAFYQGQLQGVRASVALGQTLFRGLLSAMHAGAEERRPCADCAATVCATHLAHGSLGWLAEMLAGGPAVGGASGWVPAAPAAPDPAVPQPGALYPAPAPEPEPAYAPPAAPPGGTAVAAARWNASVSGAVFLALLGLGDSTTAAASFSGRALLDEAQCAAALSTAAAVPLSHVSLQLFTTLGHGSPLLAQHPQVIATLLAGVERWIGELVGRLAQPQPAQPYEYAGGQPQVVVIDAVDLDLLVGLTEMLRAMIPHLQPPNALLLLDLALKAIALLPAEHAHTDATVYTDEMLEAIIHRITAGGGGGSISSAALAQACMVSGVRTRSALARLLPERLLSDPSPLVRAEALQTLGASPDLEWVGRCAATVVTASIARAQSSSEQSDGASGQTKVDEVLRLLRLDTKEEFEVEQLQLAIAAAPCLAAVAQLADETGRQAAERLAAFSRLSTLSDALRQPHPAIAAAEARVPAQHQSIYAAPEGGGGGGGGYELQQLQPSAPRGDDKQEQGLAAPSLNPVPQAQPAVLMASPAVRCAATRPCKRGGAALAPL